MAKKKIPNLIIEETPDTNNHFFLAVLEYRKEKYIVVVDNITEDSIGAYVLDLAKQEGLDSKQLLSLITEWFYRASYRYPLSFEFSRLGVAHLTNRIYKNFELAHVTRLIGNDFTFDLDSTPKIKRRRVSFIPAGVEVKLKKKPVEA
jgi:hypothetical protein